MNDANSFARKDSGKPDVSPPHFDYEKSIWGAGEADMKWTSPARFRLREALKSIRNLPSGSRILETGCGAGQFIRAIKKMRPDLDCHGCDISSAAISAARRKPGVSYVLCRAEELPYAENFFDAVLIFDVLEHVENPRAVLGDIRRVLKTNGIFYCFAPCEGDYLSIWHLLDKFGRKKDITKKYAGHINFFSRRSLKELCLSAGFGIARIAYSEHFLGQIAGVAAFRMMDKEARKRGVGQMNNEEFFSARGGKGAGILKRIGNFAINLESAIFRALPSPNVHLIMTKK